MRHFFNIIWQIGFALNFLALLVIFYIPLRLFFSRPGGYAAALKLQRFWAKWLRVTMGIRVKIKGINKKDWHQPCIITPNHNNYLDILICYKLVPHYFHFMAKASLTKVPLFKLLFWKTHIAFDRTNSKSASNAMQRAAADIDKGTEIVIFPEGTQNPKKGTLLRFKDGAFKLAVTKNIPIIPVVFYNNLSILPHEKKFFSKAKSGPGTALVEVCEPIWPKDFGNDSTRIKEKVYNIVQQKLSEYYGH